MYVSNYQRPVDRLAIEIYCSSGREDMTWRKAYSMARLRLPREKKKYSA